MSPRIGPSEAAGGCKPGAKPRSTKRCSSAGSSLITCTGTSQLALGPDTAANGWWSPTTEAPSCDGLVGKVDGKSQLLDAQISAMAEAGGVWEVTVKVGRGAAPGVYRGVVLDGDTPAGLLELTLRKA